ncbi:MAG: hypothetical protein J6T96_15095 [Bacteroidales bacterium]|nr:hypothetical protein [Bacteroidales bacterium]
MEVTRPLSLDTSSQQHRLPLQFHHLYLWCGVLFLPRRYANDGIGRKLFHCSERFFP